MNDLFFVARLVQGILAVTIVSAIVVAIQFSLVHRLGALADAPQINRSRCA